MHPDILSLILRLCPKTREVVSLGEGVYYEIAEGEGEADVFEQHEDGAAQQQRAGEEGEIGGGGGDDAQR